MDVLLSEDRQLLKGSAVRLAESLGGSVRYRQLRGGEVGFARERLAAEAEAGWFMLLVPEGAGGLGLGLSELAIVMEAAGGSLITEPVVAIAAVGRAIATGERAAAEKWLGAVTRGERLVLPALASGAGGQGLAAPEAVVDGRDLVVTCRREGIAYARGADAFLVDVRGPDGRAIVAVDKDAPGLTVSHAATVDGGHVGQIWLEGVRIGAEDIVASSERAGAAWNELHDTMLVGVSAEMLGVMDRALGLAVEYMKVRQQFGKAIGSFQALQHLAVNEYVRVETTRSLLYQVCAAADEARSSRAMVAAVKAQASEAALAVTKAAVQLHGAIGFTDEHDVGLYLRRAMVLSALNGNAAAQRARYAELAGIG